MPQTILGYAISNQPRDTTADPTFVADIVAAGQDVTIEYPSQYRAVASSVSIQNQDGTNPLQYSVNGQPLMTLSTGGEQNINGQNVVRVRIIAGALGAAQVLGEVTTMPLSTEAQRFRSIRGSL
jgi:hypothetical protein|tara:strand:+ start:753 stop:1124 length:372 start_codon:yes stop_codon:yes gene_type:complete